MACTGALLQGGPVWSGPKSLYSQEEKQLDPLAARGWPVLVSAKGGAAWFLQTPFVQFSIWIPKALLILGCFRAIWNIRAQEKFEGTRFRLGHLGTPHRLLD